MKIRLTTLCLLAINLATAQVEIESVKKEIILVEKYLITEKCKNVSEKSERNQCVNSEMYKFFNKNLNIDDVPKGEYQIKGTFYINLNSKLSDIKVRTENAILKKEFERLLSILPDKFKYINEDNEPVEGHYFLPINIVIDR